MDGEKKEIRRIESEMLRKGVDTYKEVKSCLDKLIVNINDKERAVTQALVVQGIIVNECLGEYFDVMKCECTKEITDALKLAEEYANIYALCKENVEAVKTVVQDKKGSDYIEDIRGAKTKKEMCKVIKDVIAVIGKDIEKIKEKIRKEERRGKEEEKR